jgi:polyhydroxyalkanoate synthesis regulator phasin
MSDPFDALNQLLSDVIVPNLQAVQASQAEQMAANCRLKEVIEELQLHLKSQFAHLSAQLTACRAEVAALHAALQAVQSGPGAANRTTLVH